MMRALSRAGLREFVTAHAHRLDADLTNPFATSAWVLHFIDTVARDDWQFYAGDDLTLLYAEPSAPSRLRALCNYYASQFSPGVPGADLAALVRDLGNVRPSPATVDLAPMSNADADGCRAAFRAGGWLARPYACFGNWTLPCAGLAFDDYMDTRPSQTVNTWTRKAKKFEGRHGNRLQLVTAPAEVAAAMQAYDAVYARSWKQPEPYPGFVSGWALICAERGWLRLGIAWLGNIPIAAQFWFTLGGRAFIFKLAYDEAYVKLSAGTVLSAFMFRQALDVDRVHEIDYLTGDDAYKKSWMTERRERIGVIACNPRTLRGALRGAYEVAGTLRQQLRRSEVATR